MQELKATRAREIDKASVTEATANLVNNETVSKEQDPGMTAGDFYFKDNFITTPNPVPTGFFARLMWKLKGRKITGTYPDGN
jgi:hypothetical protein